MRLRKERSKNSRFKSRTTNRGLSCQNLVNILYTCKSENVTGLNHDMTYDTVYKQFMYAQVEMGGIKPPVTRQCLGVHVRHWGHSISSNLSTCRIVASICVCFYYRLKSPTTEHIERNGSSKQLEVRKVLMHRF